MKIDVRYSQRFAAFVMLESLAGGASGRLAALRDPFAGGPADSPDAQAIVAEFSRVAGSQRLGLWGASAQADEQGDLAVALAARRVPDGGRLAALADAFQPVYEVAVGIPPWERHAKAERLSALAERGGLDDLLAQVSTFLGSKVNQDTSFPAMLYPMPPTNRRLVGTLRDGVVLVAVHTTGDDDVVDLGVVSHELCHALLALRPERQRCLVEHAVRRTRAPEGFQAYLALEEAVATVLGNHWVPLKIAGHAPLSDLYDDPRVEAYAQELAGLLEDALESGRRLDADLVDRCLWRYPPSLAGRQPDIPSLVSHIAVVVERSFDAQAVVDRLLAELPEIRAVECVSDEDVGNLRQLEDSLATRVVVCPPGRLASVRMPTGWSLDSLVKRLSGVRSGALTGSDKGLPPIVLIAVENLTELAEAIRGLGSTFNQ